MNSTTGVLLCKEQRPDTRFATDAMAAFPYRQLIGSAMYLLVATCPNMTFTFSKLSSFNNNPGRAHWEAALKLLGYLRQTAEVGLLYWRDRPMEVQGICDAAFANELDDRR